MAFSKILVANRGEIAVRVIQTAKAMGYQTVAVYSEADRDARHVAEADQAVLIGAAKVADSYLNIAAIIAACQKTGADAVHPGYGFLSEQASFAQACADQGITFIGPSAAAIELMGSKRRSKLAMLAAGVPCIPGYQGEQQQLEHLVAHAAEIGYPLMVKASAGGGGRGMRLVTAQTELMAALKTARSEAENAFASGELILEKALIAPRHVEMQIFADQQGNCVYLFERDCSIQRRHQKVLEEAPCPVMTPALRESMGQAAIAAARACNYVGAGTVEFLLDASGAFYFLEMNTRLQVEHPVTEMITGLDLVEWQLRVANAEALPLQQHELQINGHAIEVRLYAEDPRLGFLPQTGTILKWQPAVMAHVRVDHGLWPRDQVSAYYDPMLAKIIAHGRTRQDALRRLARAVQDTVLLGVSSNKQFLHNVLVHPKVQAGDTHTGFIPDDFADDCSLSLQSVDLDTLAICALLLSQRPNQQHWSNGLSLSRPMRLEIEGQQLELTLTQRGTAQRPCLQVECCGQQQQIELIGLAPELLTYAIDGVRHSIAYVRQDQLLFLDAQHGNLRVEHMSLAAVDAEQSAGDGQIYAPMDGALIELQVEVGDLVRQGQSLLILEAMKIQQQIKADRDGVVQQIWVEAHHQVKKRQLLMQIVDAVHADY